MVTQSFSRSGSITVSHTCSIGASISMSVWTVLMGRQTLTCGQRFTRLPVAQRVFDRAVESVHAHPEQPACLLVAGQKIGFESLHQRADQLMLLTRDERRDPARDRCECEPPHSDQWPPDDHVVANPVDQLAVADRVRSVDVERLA